MDLVVQRYRENPWEGSARRRVAKPLLFIPRPSKASATATSPEIWKVFEQVLRTKFPSIAE